MTVNEYLTKSKELQQLAKTIPLNWGNVQNNTTDLKVNLFLCKTLAQLEQHTQHLTSNEQNYFKRRWFLWQCAQIDEYLFYQANNVIKNPKSKDQDWDIQFNNKHKFDVKGTVIPKLYRANALINTEAEKEYINFYYNKQSKGNRYNIQNRLFIIHHSYKQQERSIFLRCHWELKQQAYQQFNQLITANKINFTHYQTAIAKCIFIVESIDNKFSYKIL